MVIATVGDHIEVQNRTWVSGLGCLLPDMTEPTELVGFGSSKAGILVLLGHIADVAQSRDTHDHILAVDLDRNAAIDLAKRLKSPHSVVKIPPLSMNTSSPPIATAVAADCAVACCQS